jgi:hypothetical protein
LFKNDTVELCVCVDEAAYTAVVPALPMAVLLGPEDADVRFACLWVKLPPVLPYDELPTKNLPARGPPAAERVAQLAGGVALNIAIIPLAPPGTVVFAVAIARTTFT